MGFKFKTSVLGGTFDHFHDGHKNLLEKGLAVSEKLIIGITSDEYLNNSKFKIQNSKFVEDFKARKKSVEKYLENISKSRFHIAKIEDIFGPTLEESFTGEAIIVSRETLKGAEKINDERKKRGFKELEIINVPDVLADDDLLISSERIRKGEISRKGKILVSPAWFENDFQITDKIRSELKKPWGKLFPFFNKTQAIGSDYIVSVGDETSKVLNESGVETKISVIDYKIAREKKFSSVLELGFSENDEITNIKNPAGTTSGELFGAVRDLLGKSKRQIILIDGEDDLAVLPLILLLPLGASIFYGQPERGIVKIKINEEIKAKAHIIMAKFKTLGY